ALLRSFDIIVATVAAIVFLPMMAAVAAAVYFDSGAPVLFRQERVGRGGTMFRICKFRTMTTDAGANWARPGDSRITRIGAFLRRTSLDELPQIFNVLFGDMSVVGPRPEMQEFAAHFKTEIPHYDERHVVRPGITGWAQLYLKRNLEPSDVPDVLRCDLFYVEHASVPLNVAIVVKTAFEVLSHRPV
ncbi:MAG: sugar transferase, partial [Candidatus Eremiobacteraeota bacterium]|nr:sugar transferase [Candidatus Eremiobacteraeota bacterium]